MLLHLSTMKRGLRPLAAVGDESSWWRKKDTIVAIEEQIRFSVHSALGFEFFGVSLFHDSSLVGQTHPFPEGRHLRLLQSLFAVLQSAILAIELSSLPPVHVVWLLGKDDAGFITFESYWRFYLSTMTH